MESGHRVGVGPRSLITFALGATLLGLGEVAVGYHVSLDTPPSPERTEAFRQHYREQKRAGKVKDILRGAFMSAFGPTGAFENPNSATQLYATALEDAFYSDTGDVEPQAAPAAPGAQAPKKRRLTAVNRERALIPLLVSRGDRFALAVHTYMGWLEGIDPQEIGELIFLAGIYSGIDNMTGSLDVYRQTFEVVNTMEPTVAFNDALLKLKAKFAGGATVNEEHPAARR